MGIPSTTKFRVMSGLAVTRPEPKSSWFERVDECPAIMRQPRDRPLPHSLGGNYNESHIMNIRHPELSEHEAIHQFVKAVVNEIYGGLWSVSPIEIENQDWSDAWIASSGHEIVGVLLTKDEWIDDLWVRQDHRGRGLGTKLLQYGEMEVAGRHHGESRLRVVKANRNAVSFYVKYGWNIEKEFRHETLPIEMLELMKRLS